MSSIKQKFAHAKSVFSIKTYQRPLLYIIMLMVLINLFILTVAAYIAMIIDPSFVSFVDAFANGSLKWMLTPNAILEIDNPNTLILAVTVLIIGLILFSGVIIALTTNAIKDFVQKRKDGSGKIILDDHIVILNWNSKVPELVADLLFVDTERVTVMILAQVDKSYAEGQVINAIAASHHRKQLKNLNILVKHGDPLLLSDLEDISITNAKAILIMNLDAHEDVLEGLSKSDLNVIKTVLSLGPLTFKHHPPIVVEIKHIETKDKILTLSQVVDSLGEHFIMPICFDKRLGQIIAQTLIDHHIKSIYLSLFSFQGSEIYHLENTTLEDCLIKHSHAIPIAQKGDHLYVLSLDNHKKNLTSQHVFDPIELKTKPIIESHDLDVYIVGSNNKLTFIMEAFKQYEHLHKSHFKAISIADQDLHVMIETINQTDKKTTILLLSDERQARDAFDANIINHLITLESQIKNPNVRIIVELLDPKNEHIVKDFSIENTIISNKIISLLLSKLALFKETAPFYEHLLTIAPNQDAYDDQAIIIKPAKDLFATDFPIHFESYKQLITTFYYNFKKTHMLFGYIRQQELHILEGDLHRLNHFDLQADDQLIFMRL
ncbi:MAG: hypothetical protein ACNA7K_05505 [Acholeplasmataceae bacterium]